MKPNTTQRIQFSLIYVLVGAVVLSLLQSWFVAPRTVELPMSKFLELVRENKIESVSLTEREITGRANPSALREPPAARADQLRRLLGSDDTVRRSTVTRIPGVDDSQLVPLLETHHVEFSGRVENTLWRDLLFGWVIPLALMAGIWMLIMRRVGGGATQALSFGRSKAKIYDRKELKTTFLDVAGADEAKATSRKVVFSSLRS